MQPEIEARFLNVNHDLLRKKLLDVHAKQIYSMREMSRKNFDFSDRRLQIKNGWVRVRNEGDLVTLSYKQLDHRGVDGTKEVNLVVNNFDQTCLFLESIGLEAKSFQETKRESWILDNVQIELDVWPWIKPMLEIEADSEAELRRIAKLLELDWQDALHGSVEVAYQAEYDVTEDEIDSWPNIIFSEPPHNLLERKK